jgi:hypothetical protein
MTGPVAPVRLPPGRLIEAATVMGRAVADDPLFVYLLPDAQHRVSGVPLMMEMFLRIGLAHGEVWVTPPPIRGGRLLALSHASQHCSGGSRCGGLAGGRGRVGPRGNGPVPGLFR